MLHSPLISCSLSANYEASQRAIFLLGSPISSANIHVSQHPLLKQLAVYVRPQSDRYASHPNQIIAVLLAVLTFYRKQPNAISLCLQACGLLLLMIHVNRDTEWGVRALPYECMYVYIYVCLCVCVCVCVLVCVCIYIYIYIYSVIFCVSYIQPSSSTTEQKIITFGCCVHIYISYICI